MFIETLDRIEGSAIEVAVRLAGWAAPLPTAYTAYSTGLNTLGWPSAVALAAALALEVLGLTTTHTALTLWRYNTGKRKTDPEAPVGLAMVMVGVYFVSALVMVLLGEKWPELVDWVPALFPVLSLTGVGTLALRDDHRRRLAAIEAARTERSGRQSRSSQPVATVDRAEPASLASLTVANRTRQANRERALADLLAFFSQNPDASHRQAGEAVGRSKSWVTSALGDLEQAGQVRRNGQGVEVVG